MIPLSYPNLISYDNYKWNGIIKQRLCGFVGSFDKAGINFNELLWDQISYYGVAFYTDILVLQGVYIPAGKKIS